MQRNEENGLSICGECGCDVLSADELEEVIDGVETDYGEIAPDEYVEWVTGQRVEITEEQFEASKRLVGRMVCQACCKKRREETAARLLASLEEE